MAMILKFAKEGRLILTWNNPQLSSRANELLPALIQGTQQLTCSIVSPVAQQLAGATTPNFPELWELWGAT